MDECISIFINNQRITNYNIRKMLKLSKSGVQPDFLLLPDFLSGILLLLPLQPLPIHRIGDKHEDKPVGVVGICQINVHLMVFLPGPLHLLE